MADTVDTARALEVLKGIAAGPWHVDTPTGGYVRVIGNLDCDAHDDGTPKYMHTHVCDVIDNDYEDEHARAIAVTPQFVALFAAAAPVWDAVQKALIAGRPWHEFLSADDAERISEALAALAEKINGG